MAICTDKSTTYLKRLGYNVVRHPREGINPLDLIGVQRNETLYLGRIDQLITSPPEALPQIQRSGIAANINGQSSSKLNFAIGVNILSSVLKALGGKLSVTAKYEGTRTLQFVFEDVLTDSVVPLDLGNFLRDGEVDAENLILEQYVLGKGRLFVITRTVKTRKFTVKAETKNGEEVALDVPAIKDLVSGNLAVTAASERSGTITYEGKKPLVFGFECFEVGVEGGVLSMMSSKAGVLALSADGGIESEKATILNPQGLVEFDKGP